MTAHEFLAMEVEFFVCVFLFGLMGEKWKSFSLSFLSNIFKPFTFHSVAYFIPILLFAATEIYFLSQMI